MMDSNLTQNILKSKNPNMKIRTLRLKDIYTKFLLESRGTHEPQNPKFLAKEQQKCYYTLLSSFGFTLKNKREKFSKYYKTYVSSIIGMN